MTRVAAFWVVFLSLTPASLQSAPKARVWQDGEITSRKTVPAVQRTPRSQYLYRIRGAGVRYLVVLDQLLPLELHVPIKFSLGRRHLFIQDAGGREWKATVLEVNRAQAIRNWTEP
jgi:hypothetical protein